MEACSFTEWLGNKENYFPNRLIQNGSKKTAARNNIHDMLEG